MRSKYFFFVFFFFSESTSQKKRVHKKRFFLSAHYKLSTISLNTSVLNLQGRHHLIDTCPLTSTEHNHLINMSDAYMFKIINGITKK